MPNIEVLEERASFKADRYGHDLPVGEYDALDNVAHDPLLVRGWRLAHDPAHRNQHRSGFVEGNDFLVDRERQLRQFGLELGSRDAVVGFVELLPNVTVTESLESGLDAAPLLAQALGRQVSEHLEFFALQGDQFWGRSVHGKVIDDEVLGQSRRGMGSGASAVTATGTPVVPIVASPRPHDSSAAHSKAALAEGEALENICAMLGVWTSGAAPADSGTLRNVLLFGRDDRLVVARADVSPAKVDPRTHGRKERGERCRPHSCRSRSARAARCPRR